MTISKLDELCPRDVADQKLKLSLAEPDVKLLAHVAFQVNVDYSGVGNTGVSLPLEVTIRGPLPRQFKRVVFDKAAPLTLLLTPFSGGRHFIQIREMFHNLWQGQLFVEVQGDTPRSTTER